MPLPSMNFRNKTKGMKENSIINHAGQKVNTDKIVGNNTISPVENTVGKGKTIPAYGVSRVPQKPYDKYKKSGIVYNPKN